MTKSELRKIYLDLQKALSPGERERKSRQIAELFFRWLGPGQIESLHCFIAIEKFNEIDTSYIFKRIWSDHRQIKTLVPRVNFELDEIENLTFTPKATLVRNAWEIEEPSNEESVETSKIDMVLVPGLAFDKDGHRVGYGKGYYDRFLRKCREDCMKIGLSYFDPIETITDIHTGDVRLDFLITPEKIVDFQQPVE